ncbi:hypothetical protein PV646_37565 [Streptomyces sp. ID05-26A]|nr:hypothetical protein [Streptomyces sp. ID05-26A]
MKRQRPPFVRLLRVLALVITPLLALTLVTPSALAWDRTMIRSKQFPGQCLDSNYNGDVYLLPCNSGNLHHQWIITRVGYGTGYNGHDQIRIQNEATRLFIVQRRYSSSGTMNPTGGLLYTDTAGSSYLSKIDGVGTTWRNVQLMSSHQDATGFNSPGLAIKSYNSATAVASDFNSADAGQYWDLSI